jgi:D-xylose transport system substrate-binding protein
MFCEAPGASSPPVDLDPARGMTRREARVRFNTKEVEAVHISRFHLRFRAVLALSALGVLVVALIGAGSVSGSTTKPAAAKAGPLVAVLWPENVTARWEQSDDPLFKKSIKKLVPGVQVDSLNALNDPAKQQSQAEAELAKGAKVLVVAAIDGKAFATVVNKAAAQGVTVIAYDRLINSAKLGYYVSFNSVTVGKVEASWMARHMSKGARLAIINGSPTDANAHFVNTGIHQILDPAFKSAKFKKVGEQWTPGWDPPTAQREMEQILTKTNNGVDGVVSANDGMAGGIIAALKAQGMEGSVPTTGQDASLEGVQNVIQGYQGVTAFKDFRLQAPAAAKIAAAVLNGKRPGNINGTIKAAGKNIPSVYLPVVAIDKSNVARLVKNGWIKSQFGGLAKVCKGMPKVSICK